MRTILVTGASKGIGSAIACGLAQDGFHIVIHYLTDKKGAEKTLAKIEEKGGSGRLISFNIADRQQCQQTIGQDIEQYGAYYGVVNNAGITCDTAFPAMSEHEWDSVIHTNLDSFYNVIHPCVMPMVRLRKGGRIIALSSVSGVMGNRGQVNYSAAKAGIIGACKALALELAKRGITVNCIAPGLIETAMASLEPTVEEEVMRMIPMRRMGKPNEVAGLARYLMSDIAGYITRQVISINGGMI